MTTTPEARACIARALSFMLHDDWEQPVTEWQEAQADAVLEQLASEGWQLVRGSIGIPSDLSQPAEQDERGKLIDAGQRLAFAAGALNIATDSVGHLRGERGNVLDALKGWNAVLSDHLKEPGNG